MSPLNRLNLLNPLNRANPLNTLSLLSLPGLLRLLGLMGPAQPPPSPAGKRITRDSWVSCDRSDQRAAGDPMEVDRERRELGDHPARRPGLETVEDRRGRAHILGGAAHLLRAREARADAGARPAVNQDLEQRLQRHRAGRWGGQKARGAKVLRPRHLASGVVHRGGEGCERPHDLEQLPADLAESPDIGRVADLGARDGGAQCGRHLLEVREHGGDPAGGGRPRLLPPAEPRGESRREQIDGGPGGRG